MGEIKKFPRSVQEMDFAELDALPHGIILVDRQGIILFYNRQEEEAARRKREEVIGKNFFTEVAPCAQVQKFYRHFKESISKTGWIATFDFHFPRRRNVRITINSFHHKDEILCLITVEDVAD